MIEASKTDLRIHLVSADDGHKVEWTLGSSAGSMGPYVDREVAVRVLHSKREELLVNSAPKVQPAFPDYPE